MPKLPLCVSGACRRLHCLFCAHDYHIVCALYPTGVSIDSCLDFRPAPELEGKHFRDFLGVRSRQRDDEPYSNPHEEDSGEEQWEPEGASYYNGELILQPQQKWTLLGAAGVNRFASNVYWEVSTMQHCNRTGLHGTGALGLLKSRVWVEGRHGVGDHLLRW